MPTKAQGRRSSKLKGRYADRFNITKRNKERRAKAYARWLEKRRAKRLAKVQG